MRATINFHSIVEQALTQKNVVGFLRRKADEAKAEYYFTDNEFYGDLRDVVNRLEQHSRNQFEKQHSALKAKLQRISDGNVYIMFDFRTFKLNNPDYPDDEQTWKDEQLQITIRNYQKQLEMMKYIDKYQPILDAINTLNVPTAYDGISKALEKWISGADDATLAYIIQKHSIPAGCIKPVWIKQRGRFTEAHRFRKWANMKIPEMKNCFSNLEKLHDKQATGEFQSQLAGTIYDELKKF